MTFDDLKKALFSEWLKLSLLLVAVIGGWYRFDFRVSAVEAKQQEQAQLNQKAAEQNEKLSETLAKLTDTLERINQTLREFPPHLHVDDDNVIYPGDLRLQNRKK